MKRSACCWILVRGASGRSSSDVSHGSVRKISKTRATLRLYIWQSSCRSRKLAAGMVLLQRFKTIQIDRRRIQGPAAAWRVLIKNGRKARYRFVRGTAWTSPITLVPHPTRDACGSLARSTSSLRALMQEITSNSRFLVCGRSTHQQRPSLNWRKMLDHEFGLVLVSLCQHMAAVDISRTSSSRRSCTYGKTLGF
jgi:hypothetical protein